MRPIWGGFLTFGLVNIPIKLYSAVESRAVKMRLLHKEKLSPIRYKKWCDDCNKEVKNEEITKGVEVGKNQFVVLEKEELDSIKPEKSQSIEILEFIDLVQLDPIYFNSHYYIGPERAKEKTFFLFKSALQETAKVAIGKFVMRQKEHICSILSYKSGLLLTTLNYSYEINDIDTIEELKDKPKLTEQELSLAEQLINKIYKKEFDITRYKDTFADSLKRIVQKKLKGEVITLEKKAIPETPEKNLIEALKASLK